ncbi:uncharacterized protein RAG0_14904 [Rhynchosporium agropyri]|uniref:Uncharacterized protein n=1 Tax=Rhynchosporium agropyri TaxID=914238 RepID=A0A1E1LIS3_9HELO|nr:uncharacterized protein RAG0_14904 [Rhynchosporium agropyri]
MKLFSKPQTQIRGQDVSKSHFRTTAGNHSLEGSNLTHLPKRNMLSEPSSPHFTYLPTPTSSQDAKEDLGFLVATATNGVYASYYKSLSLTDISFP